MVAAAATEEEENPHAHRVLVRAACPQQGSRRIAAKTDVHLTVAAATATTTHQTTTTKTETPMTSTDVVPTKGGAQNKAREMLAVPARKKVRKSKLPRYHGLPQSTKHGLMVLLTR